MNVFNRIVVILLLLVLVVLAATLAVFPIPSLTIAQRSLGFAASFLQSFEGANFWLFVGARLALIVLALLVLGVLLWAELRPSHPKTVRVHTEGGSLAEVTADSVARRLAWQIDQLADVVAVTPLVIARGRAVDVTLDLETAPDIDVPMKTDEVVNCAREVIVERMGLQPGKIQVRISHAPYQEEA